jgi:ABC-2 type transport system ATP-binding protein
MNNVNLAELAEASKRFGNVLALDKLSLEVRSGELLALLGPNGAGKTTAIALLLGLQRPETGQARLFGLPPEAIEVRRRVGVMLQETALVPDLRVREQLDMVAAYYPDPLSVGHVMDATGTTLLAHRPYGKLSTGQKRLVQFAVAMVANPDLLFLDEPTVGLDLQAREMVWETLRRLIRVGRSIVLTTHYLEEAEALADRVAVIAKGRLIATGTVEEMRGLVVRKRITCRTSLSVEQVESWPDVQTVAHDAHGLRITASNTESVVRRLLAADEDLYGLEVQSAGLAEAFTQLTQERN